MMGEGWPAVQDLPRVSFSWRRKVFVQGPNTLSSYADVQNNGAWETLCDRRLTTSLSFSP